MKRETETDLKDSKKQAIESPLNIDLESLVGFAWLGVLGMGVIAGAGYGTYKTLEKVPEIAYQAYNFASDLTQYWPFINS